MELITLSLAVVGVVALVNILVNFIKKYLWIKKY